MRKMISFAEAKDRWGGISIWTIRRRADEGLIRTVYFGSRRFIPMDEVERIDRDGLQGAGKDEKAAS